VPKALVWDNESAIGGWQAGKPRLTEATNAFRGTLGIKVVLCRPRDPEAKGLVEPANGYLETSFLPGRRFGSPADFNAQLSGWLVRANQRHHRRLGCRPVDRWEADRPVANSAASRANLPAPAGRRVAGAGWFSHAFSSIDAILDTDTTSTSSALPQAVLTRGVAVAAGQPEQPVNLPHPGPRQRVVQQPFGVDAHIWAMLARGGDQPVQVPHRVADLSQPVGPPDRSVGRPVVAADAL
jgi:hypothetical protein